MKRHNKRNHKIFCAIVWLIGLHQVKKIGKLEYGNWRILHLSYKDQHLKCGKTLYRYTMVHGLRLRFGNKHHNAFSSREQGYASKWLSEMLRINLNGIFWVDCDVIGLHVCFHWKSNLRNERFSFTSHNLVFIF